MAGRWTNLSAHPVEMPRFYGDILGTYAASSNPSRNQKTLLCRAFVTRPERFELPTFGSVDRRSIQLSYGRVAADSSPTSLGPLGAPPASGRPYRLISRGPGSD
jgi:hypothetical protein